jgi:DNA-binding MarR family transcriptional regulator
MAPPPKISERPAPLAALLGDAAEAMLVEFRQALVGAGYADIRPTHGCVFRFVQEDGMRLTDLAANAGMTKQSVGEVVDDLAHLGYVERIPDPADRRAKLIRLTSKGEVARGVGANLFAEIEARWADRYGADRLADLRTLLEEIAAAQSQRPVPTPTRSEPVRA